MESWSFCCWLFSLRVASQSDVFISSPRRVSFFKILKVLDFYLDRVRLTFLFCIRGILLIINALKKWYWTLFAHFVHFEFLIDCSLFLFFLIFFFVHCLKPSSHYHWLSVILLSFSFSRTNLTWILHYFRFPKVGKKVWCNYRSKNFFGVR